MRKDDRIPKTASARPVESDTAEMDEKHSSGQPLGSRLLSTEAGVSVAGEPQLYRSADV